MFVLNCANQQPPPGGPIDTSGPKILRVTPSPNTTFFTGNKIKFVFDEHVDRRSFEESILITPRPTGQLIFDWSGREVTVEIPGNLVSERTYTVVIGTGLKDRIAGNPMEAPYQFAFSTGGKLDQASITGTVFSESMSRIKIFAYKLSVENENSFNPENIVPDFVTLPDVEGNYSVMNISAGNYRVFAVYDDNNNFLFNPEFDKIAVPSKNTKLLEDEVITDVNFNYYEIEKDRSSSAYLGSLHRIGETNFYSNLTDNQSSLPISFNLYLHVKNYSGSRADVQSVIKIIKAEDDSDKRVVFNWLSDSLVNIFPVDRYEEGDSYKLIVSNGAENDTVRYSIISRDGAGVVKGTVTNRTEFTKKVFINLIPEEKSKQTLTETPDQMGRYEFSLLPAGRYKLFSFIDMNDNGRYNKGNYFPFELSEPFFVYPEILNVRARWEIENVFVVF